MNDIEKAIARARDLEARVAAIDVHADGVEYYVRLSEFTDHCTDTHKLVWDVVAAARKLLPCHDIDESQAEGLLVEALNALAKAVNGGEA